MEGEDVAKVSISARATRASARAKAAPKTSVKRCAESEPEVEDGDDDELALRAPSAKRRAVSSKVVVEIPVRATKGKAKAKCDAIEPAMPSKSKGKAKAKAVETPPPSDDDEEELMSDDENDPMDVDESDLSGSEFEPDDSEQDEAIMLGAAVRLSLQTLSQNGASSSSNRINGADPAAVLRAAAAERRLARNSKFDVDDFVDYGSDDLDASSSEDEPLSKGKVKVSSSVKKSMTISELNRARRQGRKTFLAARKENKKEGRALMLKLGRSLTHAEKTTVALHRNHPELRDVWGDLEKDIPIAEPKKAEQPKNLKVTLLPFQQESLYWMRNQEKGIWHGGMLADEMGMGKTIQIISLFVSDACRPNLVIAPTVAIMQWRNELEAHTEGLKVLVWHGSSRESDVEALKKYDVVLTTYAVLESCFRKQQSGFKRKGMIVKEKSPIHQIEWKRIVLDEAHNIKERSTNTAKAAFELKAKYRWCLSGTPLQNRVGELYSLIRFLGGDPFSYYFCKLCDCKSLHWIFSDKKSCDDCGHSPMQHTCFWNNEILTPIQKNAMHGPGKDAFKKLKILLDRMMLRRTKLQKADDLGLPPRTVIVRRDYFSPEEKELYLSLFSDAKRQFNTYLDHGTILNNYSNIFSLLTRMRQMACHPDLVLRSKSNTNKFLPDDAGEATVCRICNEIAEDAIQSKCRHIFDRECIKQYLESSFETNPDCPVCHVPLTIDLEAPALENEESVQSTRQGILGRLNLDNWRSSSKIEALVEELSNLRLQDATTKSIVFSQFVNFLDLIAFRLQRAGFTICRLEGTMSPQARDATIKHFMNNVDVTVFLVSLKAGGVALNLTEASRVYLMDSWWNPAVEYQAMDRIHRLGQRRPVQAIKLVVEDSIESRIVQLQEKKSAMVDATLSTDDSAMGRLTPEDLGFLFRMGLRGAIWYRIFFPVLPDRGQGAESGNLQFDGEVSQKGMSGQEKFAGRLSTVSSYPSHNVPVHPSSLLLDFTMMASKEYTWEEIAQHNKEGDVWVAIDAKVYDLSKFASLHPGGANVIWAESIAGKDATQAFFGLHRHEVLLRPQYKRLQIGTVQGQSEVIRPPPPGATSKVPYGEASWLTQGYFSPYYSNNHRKFQKAIREFMETVVKPESIKCDESGKKISQGVVDKMAELNIIAMRQGPGKHLEGRTLMGGIVKPEEFDYFHEGIVHMELGRVCSRAVIDGVLAGLVIGLPPVLNYGSPELKARVVAETLSGKKYLALAISEAFAGSDVGGLQTIAVRDGDYWVVTGTKKWITNGTFADYFTTGCKTESGFTVILIERGPGVTTKPIKTAYSSVAGTAFVTFDKVRVPVTNTLGKIGGGMSVILSNFNHERWMVTATSIAAQRLAVEECMKWSTQRVVFGKPLNSQAVIRAKLANMICRIESCQNWWESVTHQMNNMNYAQQSDKLAGPIGLLKQFVSRSGRETAEDATQVFGGRALTVTGMGKFIENYHRTSGFDAILAGAEDVLGDLGVRQALKKMPRDARL
ncbi:unnamed protein product [Cyclocybe aegerita]|uniref:Uncharacterized protein n=1 Tax=Cyclocybe aegerita TaxID=1973307 RepID=A0A8S0XE63_CYCAE|nr:unnamed protein product [Cyclocybe aegerita]